MSVMKEVNVSGCPDIEKASEKMAQVFEKFTAEGVKKDSNMRKEATATARSMLDDIRSINLVS